MPVSLERWRAEIGFLLVVQAVALDMQFFHSMTFFLQSLLY